MTKNFKLRRLFERDKEAFCNAYLEFKESGDFDFVSHYTEGMDFSSLLRILDDQENGRYLPEGYVPSTFLFAFVGSKLVGRVMIRHRLNDYLQKVGGHIGYGVVPSERRKGYAKKMSEKSIDFAQSIGIESILITCDENNIPSKRIIEKIGGVFDGYTIQGQNLPRKCLYWITKKGS
jgi:predicted acetyltransferase